MIKVKVLGKEYPCNLSMGALLRFNDVTGKDPSDVTDNDVMSAITLMWCGIKAGCSVEGVPFELDHHQLADALDPEEFNRFISGLAQGDVKKNGGAGNPT